MKRIVATLALLVLLSDIAVSGENWSQYQYDSRHSGNVTDRHLAAGSLTLQGTVALTDAIFTSPVIVEGRIYVVDGAGVVFCIDAQTLAILWKTETDTRRANCNNVSSPAFAGGYLHVGTTAGTYFVLNAESGKVVRRIVCGEPIFSAPVVTDKGVYFATLGSRVYGLTPDGKIRWKWSYLREVLKFTGDPWDGGDWAKHKKTHVSWRDQFLCSRNIAAFGDTVVVPAGGVIVWLRDAGDHAVLRAGYTPRESPATYGLSMDEQGNVYRQWYRRDNTGRVEILKLDGDKVVTSFVRGTETRYSSDSSLSFSSVSLRGGDVYRTRPEEGAGLVKHLADGSTKHLDAYSSIAAPVLVGEHALVSGLDGTLYVVSLQGEATRKLKTAFGRPITAPAAVADGRIVFGCEDGYLYVMAAGGKAQLPAKPLDLTRIRSPLSGKFASPEYDWSTNFGNQANTNRTTDQGLGAPFKTRWLRRVEGTIKQASVAGGGRMYTHTAEGQIFAVEQETGRLLWRVYHPGVHVSYTAPIYYQGKLLVPQAGLKKSRLRCFDAANGKLLWEAPFTGSPSWNRQLPPLVHDGLVFYQFSSGKYSGKEWLFEHQRTFGFPDGHKPLVKAWDLETGKERWSLDFSKQGAGGDDAGLCLMDGKLYYSCYFGRKETLGLTAAIEPATGKVLWSTTKYAVHGGCTISGKNGRLYLGGYNAPDGKKNHIWCLDAKDGSLLWESDPLGWATHVVTIADDFVFSHAQYRTGTLLTLAGGKKICNLTKGYNCTRFTMAGRYLLGSNMDIYDTSQDNRLVSTGPAVDVITCTGAHISNGRIFFTANGGGLQLSMSYGKEAENMKGVFSSGRVGKPKAESE